MPMPFFLTRRSFSIAQMLPVAQNHAGLPRRAAWTAAAALVLQLAGCVTPAPYSGEQVPQGQAVSVQALQLAQTRLQLGTMYFQDGRNDVALGEVEQALAYHPQYVDAYNLQGWIYLSQRQYALAQESFGQALRIRPGNPDTLYNQGWLHCRQRAYEQAQSLFDAVLAVPRYSEEGRVRTLLAKGVCQQEAGQIDEALHTLAHAFELAPGDPGVIYNYASALYAKGDYIRARFYLRRVRQGGQADAAALWLGVRTEYRLGDHAAMRQWAQELSRRFPHAQETLQYEQGAFDE